MGKGLLAMYVVIGRVKRIEMEEQGGRTGAGGNRVGKQVGRGSF